jgi:hypothetical protein
MTEKDFLAFSKLLRGRGGISVLALESALVVPVPQQSA